MGTGEQKKTEKACFAKALHQWLQTSKRKVANLQNKGRKAANPYGTGQAGQPYTTEPRAH